MTGTAVRPRSLWHDRNFLRLWGGQTASSLGEQVAGVAVPVTAVLLLRATAFQVGVLNAAETAAFLAVGLPAGVWIDHMRKRHVMIAADAVRAVAMAAIPVLFALGALAIWHLIVVALVVSVASVFFDVSYQSVIPSMVPAPSIAEANGKLEATGEGARLAGPAVSGGLIGLVAAPATLAITSVTYVISFVALLFTRDSEQPRVAEDRQPLVREIGEGLSWVFGNPLLRRIVGCTSSANLFNAVTATLLPLFLLRELHFTPLSLGLVFSLGAIGGLLGGFAAPRIARRLGEARAIPVSAILFSLIAVVVPVAAVVPAIAFPLLVVQGFLGSAASIVYNVTQVTFRQRITPARLLGRMNASIRFVVWGVMPLAALAAGVLATVIGIVPTLWIGAVGELLSCLFVVVGPFWRIRDLPDTA